MLKRLICIFFAVCIALSLCGCKGYREADNCYIVTAIGFDGKDKTKVTVEVIDAGSETKSSPRFETLSGKGDTPEDAVFSLNNQISKTLVFDHCSAVVIGKNVGKKGMARIIEYVRELKELNFSVYVFITESAEKLFKNSKSTSAAKGFDIAGNVRETKKDTGVDYKNKFYEVYKAYKSDEFYSLPNLTVKSKKIVINGQSVYKKEKCKMKLNGKDSLMYSFVKNSNVGGRIYMGNDFAEVNKSRFFLKNGKYNGKLYIKNNSKNFGKSFKKRLSKFLKKYNGKIGIKSEFSDIEIREGL